MLRVSNTRLEQRLSFAARPKTSGSHSFRAPYIAGKCIGTRDLLLTVSCHFHLLLTLQEEFDMQLSWYEDSDSELLP